MTEPLEPNLRSLLEAERSLPEDLGDAPDRVLSALRLIIGPFGPGGAGPVDPGGAGPVDPVSGGAAAAAPGGATASSVVGASSMLVHPLVTGLVGLALGTASGAAIAVAILSGEAVGPPEPPMAVEETSVPPVIVVAGAPDADGESAQPDEIPANVEPLPAPELADMPTAGVTLVDEEAEATAGERTGLSRELVLLDRARSALAFDRPQDAVNTLTDHEKQFPEGRLGEERDALMVQALLAAGRTEDARVRATIFRLEYPESTFLPSMNGQFGAEGE